jgi:hypothetical protein
MAGEPFALTNMIRACGSLARICRAAVIPLNTGNPMSRRIKSGRSAAAFSIASNPLDTSATIDHR